MAVKTIDEVKQYLRNTYNSVNSVTFVDGGNLEVVKGQLMLLRGIYYDLFKEDIDKEKKEITYNKEIYNNVMSNEEVIKKFNKDIELFNNVYDVLDKESLIERQAVLRYLKSLIKEVKNGE